MLRSERQWVVNLAMKLQGIPYIWGGSTPAGFDCSGFVIWILQVFDILPAGDWTSQGLSRIMRATSEPQPGDLVFYGSATDAITHVMIFAGEQSMYGRMVIGASGGDSHCTSVEEAHRRGARVKLKPINYRRDLQFVGDLSTIDLAH